MKEKKKYVSLIVLDLLTFVLMIIGITFSIFDVRFMVDYPRLSTLHILMTFTGLSNVFIGLVCLSSAIYRFIKRETKLNTYLFLLKIIALADITITLVITATYLAPHLKADWWRLYINNNIFNHFLAPIIAIVTFILLEDYVELDYRYCFLSVVPLLLYSVVYIINVYAHLKPDGSTDLAYDIYGFCRFGVGFLILFLIGFLLVSLGLTFLYRLINKKNRS